MIREIRRICHAQADLLTNALSLGGATVVTSVLGAVYWWVAARLLDPVSVGYGSAAISAATLLATVGMAGYGSLLLGQIAMRGPDAGSLIATGLAIAGGASLVLGAVYGVLVPSVAAHLAPYCGSVLGVLLFAATASLTSTTTVFDDAMVGLFLGPVQLTRNAVFAVAKVVAVAAIAIAIPDRSGVDVLASWALGTAISLLAVSIVLRRRRKRLRHLPRIGVFRESARTAAMHHWINLAAVLPRLALPILVTALVSAVANGYLYPAWIVATLAYVIPTHLSTSLFAVGAANRALLGHKTRTSVNISIVVGIPATLLLALFAHPLLLLFGSAYAEHASGPMRWLMLSYPPNIARFHYLTVLRVEGHLRRAATVMTGLGMLEVAAVVVGAGRGLTGVCATLAVAMWLEGFATVGPVLRTIRAAPRGTVMSIE